MADIKQATKWMQEGKLVRRVSRPIMCPVREESSFQKLRYTYAVDKYGEDYYPFKTDDLLADDWEIAE